MDVAKAQLCLESSFILEGLTCLRDHHTRKDFESKNQHLGCVFSAPPLLLETGSQFNSFSLFHMHEASFHFLVHLQTLGYCVWVSSTTGDSQFVKSSPFGTSPGSLT